MLRRLVRTCLARSSRDAVCDLEVADVRCPDQIGYAVILLREPSFVKTAFHARRIVEIKVLDTLGWHMVRVGKFRIRPHVFALRVWHVAEILCL